MAHTELDLRERRRIEDMLYAKVPVSKIAAEIGRHRSTIYRDIKRNRYIDDDLPELNGYHALVAQDKYEQRRAIHRKMIVHPELKGAIEDRLKAGWSPEQIAGRMRLERHPIRVSHETIYRFAYSKDGRAEQFYRHLPEHRRRRRPHGYRRHNRTHIFDAVVMRNEDRQSKPIMEALIQGLAPLPADARQSITFNRGAEFSAWKHLKAGIGADAWFRDPQAPYQKGTVENTNNRLRKYLPRSTEPTALTNRYIKSICHRLNSTPRKCLGYHTPAKIFETKLIEIQNRLE